MTTIEISQLSNDALIAETKRVAEVERRSMAELLTLLIEVERRELCEQLGYPSLFAYCRKELGLSEQAAYSRITAARAVRRFPAMLPMLGDGALTLSSVGLLAPHLTEDNHEALLAGAKDRSTRDVQKMIAHVHPQPDIEPSLRALPSRAILAPLAPKRYLLKVTIGQETHDKLERATALLRHVIPGGDPAEILDRALTALIENAERRKYAATTRWRRPSGESSHRAPTTVRSSPPMSNPRHIPAAVRRVVWARDEGRCTFTGSAGRCTSTAFLEFHHVVPFAAGGPATLENLQIRCRVHNAHEARVFFGTDTLRRASP